MKLYRLAGTTACLLALLSLCTAFREHYVEKEEDEQPKRHQGGLLPSLLSHDRPRVISIFSKPADPNGPKKVGLGIVGHVGNVLQGGTIGIQVQPIAGIQGIVGHAKKIITGGGRDRVGNPNHENPEPPKGDHWGEHPKDDHWGKPPRDGQWGKPPRDGQWGKPPRDGQWGKPPRDGQWGKPPRDEHLEKPPTDDPWGKPPKGDHLEEQDWEMKEPEKVPDDKDEYSWDDIGEYRHSTEVPIEDIIMPRTRPKRFIESKIYHVPLTFRSNGKPYKVVDRTRENSLDSKE